MCTNTQRCGVLVILMVVVIVGVGCQPIVRAGESPIATSSPDAALTGTVQIGEPRELMLADERLGDRWLDNVRVDGNVLLATIGSNEQTRVVAIDLRSGEVVGLDTPFVAVNEQWRISERYYAYTQPSLDEHRSVARLHVHDVFTGESFVLEGNGGTQCCPDVSGDVVVWAEVSENHSWDVYAYNMLSRRLTPVATRPFIQTLPVVRGEWVLYLQDRGDDFLDEAAEELYLHNLVTGEDALLGSSPFAFRCDGCTYGLVDEQAMWVGWVPGQSISWPPSLHFYDLSTQIVTPLDTSSAACPPRGFTLGQHLMKWACDYEQMAGYDLAQRVFFRFPALPETIVVSTEGRVESWSTYLSDAWVVWLVVEREDGLHRYSTPAEPMPMPTLHSTAVSPSLRFRLFVAPVIR